MQKVFVLILLVGFALVGCSQGQSSKSDDAQSEKSFKTNSETITSTKVSSLDLNGEEKKEIFTKAVRDSKQEPGIANMTNPDYKFSIGEESYLLWITNDSGTIMNIKDTHTIYTLSSKSVKEVSGIVNSG